MSIKVWVMSKLRQVFQPQNTPCDAKAPPPIWFFIVGCLITSHSGPLRAERLESRDWGSRLRIGSFFSSFPLQ